MTVKDPFPTRLIVVGNKSISRYYTACSIGNEGLECLFHCVETNLQRRRYEDFPEAR